MSMARSECASVVKVENDSDGRAQAECVGGAGRVTDHTTRLRESSHIKSRVFCSSLSLCPLL